MDPELPPPPPNPDPEEPRRGVLLFGSVSEGDPEDEPQGLDRPLVSPPRRRPGRWLLLALVLAIPATWAAYRVLAPGGGEELVFGGPPAPVAVVGSGAAPVSEGLSAVGEPERSAPAGSTVALAVRALGTDGAALPDAPVSFRIVRGAGLLTATAAMTDSSGTARVALALPAIPGITTVEAVLERAPSNPIRFDVAALTAAPARLEIVGGDEQEAAAGGLLPERMAVRVTDASGDPVAGAEVYFRVVSGGGLAGPTRLRTDSLGEASARWRLGPDGGTQELVATTAELVEGVTFTANALGGSAPADEATGEAPAGSDAPSAWAPVTVADVGFVLGGTHVCVLAGGNALCRGGNDRGQGVGDSSGRLAALAAGGSHACGLDNEGAAWCWGANESGQLGDGTRTDRSAPTPLATELRFSMLSGGAAHTCGLAGGGVLACWGQNVNGQLGDGSRNDRLTPQVVAGGRSFTWVAAGWHHTCALSANGDTFCWGLNSSGQVGDGTRLDRLSPTRVTGQFQAIVAGSAHTCGISGSEVRCWGRNDFGQLGDGTTENHPAPVAVQGLPGRPLRIAAGAVHTCAIVSTGETWCWGQNLHGQLGNGSTTGSNVPMLVEGGLEFARIYAGGASTCAFTADWTEYCWGLNRNGQLGDGTRVNRAVPTRIVG